MPKSQTRSEHVFFQLQIAGFWERSGLRTNFGRSFRPNSGRVRFEPTGHRGTGVSHDFNVSTNWGCKTEGHRGGLDPSGTDDSEMKSGSDPMSLWTWVQEADAVQEASFTLCSVGSLNYPKKSPSFWSQFHHPSNRRPFLGPVTGTSRSLHHGTEERSRN